MLREFSQEVYIMRLVRIPAYNFLWHHMPFSNQISFMMLLMPPLRSFCVSPTLELKDCNFTYEDRPFSAPLYLLVMEQIECFFQNLNNLGFIICLNFWMLLYSYSVVQFSWMIFDLPFCFWASFWPLHIIFLLTFPPFLVMTSLSFQESPSQECRAIHRCLYTISKPVHCDW